MIGSRLVLLFIASFHLLPSCLLLSETGLYPSETRKGMREGILWYRKRPGADEIG
jgi:hypothetical protein